jgi:hypothetical protein
MAKYVWGVVNCATRIGGVPRKFQDISRSIEKFYAKVRNLVAVGVAAVFRSICYAKNVAVFIMFTLMIPPV